MIAAAAPNQLREFLKRWPEGTTLGTRPGERLTRNEIRMRVLRRAFGDPEFKRELVENTLLVHAILFDECLGIDRFKFTETILEYPVLYETADRIYMEIPTCHRGCTWPAARTADTQTATECKICDRAFPLPAASVFVRPDVRPTETLTRRGIEGYIQKRAAWDAKFAGALSENPFASYVNYATELCAGRVPRYLRGVRELELVHESVTTMYLIVPTCERFALELDC